MGGVNLGDQARVRVVFVEATCDVDQSFVYCIVLCTVAPHSPWKSRQFDTQRTLQMRRVGAHFGLKWWCRPVQRRMKHRGMGLNNEITLLMKIDSRYGNNNSTKNLDFAVIVYGSVA